MKALVAAILIALPALAQDWPQWGGNAQHTERTAAVGQNLNRNFADIEYDTLTLREIFAYNGELLVHYQAPLVDGNDVYMMTKSGTFSADTFATQNWNEMKLSWNAGRLEQQWQFASDWRPPANITEFFEPVFHPALANGALYVPGAAGTIFKVNKTTGAGVRINPFGTLDANAFVMSPLTVDASGNVLFNVIRLASASTFYAHDVIDSWLVRVSPSDTVEKVSYSVLTAGAPRGTDLCLDQFTDEPLPWPPSPGAVPRSIPCGTQRPGVNIAPAIASDGTIYVVTRAHFESRSAYLIAVTPNLQQKWTATLRDRFNDGCGVPPSQGGSLPPNGANGGCRNGAPLGVDPATNTPGGGRVNDNSSSTPVVAPDGSIFYGAYTRYNYLQGHLMHFSATGTYLGAYNFGWDVTPAIYQHDGTYSVITKENHYGDAGSYCSDPVLCGVDRSTTNPAYPEGYFITQLSRDLNVEWIFKATNTETCGRRQDGTIACVSDHPFGFEWCVNAFVVDANGILYANSEDGWLYAIAQGGRLKNRIFQQLALGAAYTPTSMDALGRIYSQNAGHLFVAGGERRRSAAH